MIVDGAVYTPFTMVPGAGPVPEVGHTCHVIPALGIPLTLAVKVADCPAPRVTVCGLSVIATGCSETVALALFVVSAALVAVTVTVCGLVMEDGA